MPQRPQKVNLIANYAGGVGPIVSLSGTALVVLNAWKGKYVRGTSGSATTLTVPTNATSPIPVGSAFNFVRAGAGTFTVAAAGGVTVNSAGGLLAIAAQFGVITLVKVGTNEWDLTGNLA